MPRLFVALSLPPELRSRLAALARTAPGGRAVRPEALHLTLRFVGEVDEAVCDRLKGALGSIRANALSLNVSGLGCFPPRGEPRVIWAGVEPDEPLRALRAAVEEACLHAGLPSDRRRFRAHVTLSRPRGAAPRDVADWLAEHAPLGELPFEVRELTLFSSELRPDGAVHRVEARRTLASPGS